MHSAASRPIRWRSSWRIIPSRFPPVGVFDRVADAGDLEAVIAIESLTNDRLRDEAGDITLVPREQRIAGPGTSPIMAAFTHLNPEGSRFSDGSYGVYYAADGLPTAIAETVFHRERFMAATRQPPIELQMRSYSAAIDAQLHDIRGQQVRCPELYSPSVDEYAPAQAFARRLREAGSDGIVYTSVRDPDGECAAVFRPDRVSPVVQGAHYRYVWNGTRISDTLLVQRAV